MMEEMEKLRGWKWRWKIRGRMEQGPNRIKVLSRDQFQFCIMLMDQKHI